MNGGGWVFEDGVMFVDDFKVQGMFPILAAALLQWRCLIPATVDPTHSLSAPCVQLLIMSPARVCCQPAGASDNNERQTASQGPRRAGKRWRSLLPGAV